jgi:hypothetical protein
MTVVESGYFLKAVHNIECFIFIRGLFLKEKKINVSQRETGDELEYTCTGYDAMEGFCEQCN